MAVQNYLSTIWGDVYGNGRPGLLNRADSFFTEFEAVEFERARVARERHAENSEKLAVIASRQGLTQMLVGIFGSILALCALMLTIWQMNHKTSFLELPTHWIQNQLDSAPSKVYAHEQVPPPEHSIGNPPPELR